MRSGVYIFVRGEPKKPTFSAHYVEVSPHNICKLGQVITSARTYGELEARLLGRGYSDYLSAGCWLNGEQRASLAIAAMPGAVTAHKEVGFFEALFGRLFSCRS